MQNSKKFLRNNWECMHCVVHGCNMVSNLANIVKKHCFSKDLPTFLGNIFLIPKFCHFSKYILIVGIDETIHFGLYIK